LGFLVSRVVPEVEGKLTLSFNGAVDGRSGLDFGLLSDLFMVNVSFSRRAGEIDRIERDMLPRRPVLSVDGNFSVDSINDTWRRQTGSRR